MSQVQSRLLFSTVSGGACKWVRTTSWWRGRYAERLLESCTPHFKTNFN